MPITQRAPYTTTEVKILKVLDDGRQHTLRELHGCLRDELNSMAALYVAMYRLRKKLAQIGQTVVCVSHGRKRFYQHVRLLNYED